MPRSRRSLIAATSCFHSRIFSSISVFVHFMAKARQQKPGHLEQAFWALRASLALRFFTVSAQALASASISSGVIPLVDFITSSAGCAPISVTAGIRSPMSSGFLSRSPR